MESGFSGKAHSTIAGIAQKHLVLESAVVHTIPSFKANIIIQVINTTAANTSNPTMYQPAKVQRVCSDLDKLALLGTD